MSCRVIAWRLLAPAVALSMAAVPGMAQATGKNGKVKAREGASQVSRQGQNLGVQTKIQTTVEGSPKSAKSGSLTPANSNWDPPACWYEPAYSPKQIQAAVKAIRKVKVFGVGDLVGGAFDAYFKDGNPYKDYNLDKQGEGLFWAAAVDEKRKDAPDAKACDKLPFWVPNGATPKEPLAVSPKILAEYAYDELPVPGTEITMAPEGTTKVNLPTWVWLDKAKFKKVSVTASIPGSGLSATATAEPVSLSVDPGTQDAETYPASGQCPIEGGKIGAPRAKGTPADTLPPCGVQYLRSSGDGSYNLRSTLTWRITWTSTTGEGGDLPDGEFGAEQRVAAEEIQSVNR
ncbi:hypothetical protein AB0Q95_13750 [Streptomyces sp. NPDC059900]|uniref:hypothetical protein n=1 Tax=Streptomyces sp. NPDC059900 TaxID=3155816 RepID=UPI003447BCC7